MNDLKHVGILGMKWGVRKGKGSPTAKSSSDHITASKLKKKKLSEMSNEELQTLTKRMQLEKQYKDLKGSDITRGQKLVSKITDRVGDKVLSSAIDKAVDTGLSKAFDFVLSQVKK